MPVDLTEINNALHRLQATSDPDPLLPFWSAIESSPSADLPRLVLADRLDEENTPEADTLATVLRWCCATGRRPGRITCSAFTIHTWLRCHLGVHRSRLRFSLPDRLFGYMDDTGQTELAFETARLAYQALASAWSSATRKRWWRKAWQPSWERVG